MQWSDVSVKRRHLWSAEKAIGSAEPNKGGVEPPLAEMRLWQLVLSPVSSDYCWCLLRCRPDPHLVVREALMAEGCWEEVGVAAHCLCLGREVVLGLKGRQQVVQCT